MSTTLQTALSGQVADAAAVAGLTIASSESALASSGAATTKFILALASDPSKTELLELSENLDLSRADLISDLQVYLAETAKRLRNPRPDVYVTLHGLPLTFGKFNWPFHSSTSGADTLLVHGEIKLEDGTDSVLHAKISASMTVTFAEIVPAPEQPFAEAFIYNAVRKTMDQGQLELVKSGNRQPVPVTTRYYSRWQKKFTFNDTSSEQRHNYLAAKAYWLSGVLGERKPVWLTDPRDAQYLNTTVDELKKTAEDLAADGLILLSADMEFATPTDALMGHKAEYDLEVQQALTFIKPSFNEDMRGGHTNM
ncbi:hypothetical protein HDF16_002999 [Granulicella aggregans]|uniref:Uncharacterized protein n=1 Tax=Granulicella aggregans TaxID=474949 RepID=A0A7W7ZE74_9BACT|nr:hypothetical protein [Granulicella aggregans]MBB5058285.1 hypothetical protein [Granulicella aggregans]